MRFVFKDDDWWMFVVEVGVKGGFLVVVGVGGLGNCIFVVLKECVFFNVVMLCVVCLKDCEFWDNVFWVLLSEFFFEIVVIIGGFGVMVVLGWVEFV